MKGGSPTAFDRLMVVSRFTDQSGRATLKISAGPRPTDLVGRGAWVLQPPLSSTRTPRWSASGALDKGALDLAVQRRVQAAADIVQHVGAFDHIFAGQGVDGDLGAGSAMRRSNEGAAPSVSRFQWISAS